MSSEAERAPHDDTPRTGVETASSAPEGLESLRPSLLGLAYRMLGTRDDAQDIVQDAFARLHSSGTDVANPRAYLRRVVTNLCIDELRSARRRRESYVGTWLPEPIQTGPAGDPAFGVERSEAISFAFLRLLETLTPVQRAVFLLHDVFGVEFAEIAESVGLDAASCRQIARRARERVQAGGIRRFDAPATRRAEFIRHFERAVESGDISELRSLLTEEVIVYADSGGKAVAARRPVVGRENVSRFILGVAEKFGDTFDRMYWLEVNGEPAIVSERGGKPVYVWTFELTGDVVTAIYVVANPDKLAGLRAEPL